MENFEKRAGAVEKLLQDEESKMVFRFRNQYSLTNDKRYLLDLIYESCKKYGRRYKTNMDLVRFIQKILSVGKADVCIFGAGGAGNVVVQLLYEYGLIENENINVYFADNNKELQGKERKHHNPAMRLMIKRPEEIPSTAFVIAAQYDHLHAVEVYNQCRKLGIDEGNIFFPEWLYEYQIGDIYFSKEIYKLGENETFYDIGSYDLENTRQFINAAGTYKEIYALEADAVSFNKCEQIAEKNMWSNIHLINAAAWSSNTQLRFESAPNGEFGGSKVNIQGGGTNGRGIKNRRYWRASYLDQNGY